MLRITVFVPTRYLDPLQRYKPLKRRYTHRVYCWMAAEIPGKEVTYIFFLLQLVVVAVIVVVVVVVVVKKNKLTHVCHWPAYGHRAWGRSRSRASERIKCASETDAAEYSKLRTSLNDDISTMKRRIETKRKAFERAEFSVSHSIQIRLIWSFSEFFTGGWISVRFLMKFGWYRWKLSII